MVLFLDFPINSNFSIHSFINREIIPRTLQGFNPFKVYMGTKEAMDFVPKFAVNDSVVIFLSGSSTAPNSWNAWHPAQVLAVNTTHTGEYRSPGYVCYSEERKLEYFISDETSIRKLDFDPQNDLEFLTHFIQHGDGEGILQNIVDSRGVNMASMPGSILLTAATFGNISAFFWLVNKHRFALSVDSKGRNILHIAAYAKQNLFLKNFVRGNGLDSFDINELVRQVDSSGMTLFHHLVITNNIQLIGYLCGHASGFRDEKNPLREALVMSTDPMDRIHMVEWTDNKNRTALDYAITFKRTDVVAVLRQYIYQMRLFFTLSKIISATLGDQSRVCLDVLKSFTSNGFEEGSLSRCLFSCNQDALSTVASLCAADGVLEDGLHWLDKNYSYDGFLSFRRHSVELIFKNAIMGPKIHRRNADSLASILIDSELSESKKVLLFKALYHHVCSVLWTWNGQDDICDYLSGKIHNVVKKENLNIDSYRVDNAACKYAGKFPPELESLRSTLQDLAVAKLHEQLQYGMVTSSEQLKVVEWMLNDLGMSLPPLRTLVESGYCGLFIRLCDLGKFNLHAPLADYYDSGDGEFCSDEHVGNCLLKIALDNDNLHLFKWLYIENGFRGGIDHYGIIESSFLKASAHKGAFIICKWLLANMQSSHDSDETTQEELSGALYSAVVGRYYLIAFYFTTVIKNVNATDPVHNAIRNDPYYNHPSEDDRNILRQWSEDIVHKEFYAGLLLSDQVLDLRQTVLKRVTFDKNLYYRVTEFHSFEPSASPFAQAQTMWDTGGINSGIVHVERCVLWSVVASNECETLQWIRLYFDQQFNAVECAPNNRDLCTSYMLRHLLRHAESLSCDNEAVDMVREWVSERDDYFQLRAELESLCKSLEQEFVNYGTVKDVEINIGLQIDVLKQFGKLEKCQLQTYNTLETGTFTVQFAADDSAQPISMDVFQYCIENKCTHLIDWLFEYQQLDMNVRWQRVIQILVRTEGHLHLITNFVGEMLFQNVNNVHRSALTAIMIAACRPDMSHGPVSSVVSAKLRRNWHVVNHLLNHIPYPGCERVPFFGVVFYNAAVAVHIPQPQTVLHAAADAVLQCKCPQSVRLLEFLLHCAAREQSVNRVTETTDLRMDSSAGETFELRPVLLTLIDTLRDTTSRFPPSEGDGTETSDAMNHCLNNFSLVLDLLIKHGYLVTPLQSAVLDDLSIIDGDNVWDEVLVCFLIEILVVRCGYKALDCIRKRCGGRRLSKQLLERYNHSKDAVELKLKLAKQVVAGNRTGESMGVWAKFLSRDIVTAVYPGGSSLLHVAASFNLVAIVAYMDTVLHCPLDAVDLNGVSVLESCRYANAADTANYIKCSLAMKKLKGFYAIVCARQHHRAVCKRCVIRLQAWYRGLREFRLYQGRLQALRGTWKHFSMTWGAVIAFMQSQRQSKTPLVSVSWSQIKTQFDMHVDRATDADDFMGKFDSGAIQVLIDHAADVGINDDDIDESAQYHQVPPSVATTAKPQGQVQPTVSPPHCPISIELSQAVEKWRSKADAKYRDLFQKKLVRLAAGDCSHTMSKLLQGCKYPLFETKLDVGMRILWTQLRRGVVNSILVWFVCKHDDISTAARSVDRSYSRLAREPTITTNAAHDASLVLCDEDVLLDPVGNCPLKIYTTSNDQIPLLANSSWSPSLLQSSKQQEIQGVTGTVLLLGRSGTGKTICLSDRMSRDRQAAVLSGKNSLSQLFVSRSKRLCEFVKSYQEQQATESTDLRATCFMTLDRFLVHIETALYAVDTNASTKSVYSPLYRVDFPRFTHMMRDAIAESALDAIVLWTQIRSFIKGSIEAVLQREPLLLGQYLDTTVFGLERCRLNPEQRTAAYKVYTAYAAMLVPESLWDDADRVTDILKCSRLEPLSVSYDKVYVDEVQDNTQAEIVLYFLAAGMNTQALFLAGDPAQSVVEGVDFRFEDVRSIVYKLSGGKQTIQRPMKLFVNYRSHSGILNCAAAVLEKLFSAFPGSAKVLPKDAGLFKGPRPAVSTAYGISALSEVLKRDQRLMVICPDERVASVEEAMENAGLVNLVLGIRAAKGLEFQDIVLYDFFSSIPTADHKAWKSLLTEDCAESGDAHKHPQIESQLKLLYTAITRSCNRLIFVESESTTFTSVVFRWLRSLELAENLVLEVSEGVVVMTCDEWRVRGIDFALSAEGSEAESFLQKAQHCFVLAGDGNLQARAEAQLGALKYKNTLVTNYTGKHQVVLSAADEMTAAAAILKCLESQLVDEAREVCALIAPLVKEEKYFKEVCSCVLKC